MFRFFDVSLADVDEIARLSDEAWRSFETDSAFAAEPQALFAPSDRSATTGVIMTSLIAGETADPAAGGQVH